MNALPDDYEFQFFKIDDDGSLVFMHENYSYEYGCVIPNIGDEIPCPISWIGTHKDIGLNGFLLIKRRVFFRAENRVAFICNYHHAKKEDYELF